MKNYLRFGCVIILTTVLTFSSGCNKLLEKKPVNVIFIVPDGFSYTAWSAIRYITVGQAGLTNLDRFPHSARYSSYASDSWICDSAAGITAMMCGEKCDNGIIGQDSTAVYKESDGKNLQTIMEYAASKGMATGIITNTTIYHATSAGCFAHINYRGAYSEIAAQMIDGEFTPDVIMGGGRKFLFPIDYVDPESGDSCSRKDMRNIPADFEKIGYKYFDSKAGFEAWNPVTDKNALGIFEYNHMKYEAERINDKLGEPGLWEMTEKTLRALNGAENGFFLLVEAGKIDHAAHQTNSENLIYESIAFDKTLKTALDFLEDNPNTLILVAADHGTGGANGIAFRDSLGVVSTDGMPGEYTHKNGDEFPDSLNVKQPIVFGWSSNPLSMEIDTVKYGYRGSHTSEDLIAFAAGFGSEYLNGYIDNTDLYNIMKFVMPHDREGEGAVLRLNDLHGSEKASTHYGSALFLASLEPAQTLTMMIYDMNGEKLFEEVKSGSAANPVEIKWQPSRPVHSIPGIFRYEYYIDGGLKGVRTFILR